jgi:hypothetical protein
MQGLSVDTMLREKWHYTGESSRRGPETSLLLQCHHQVGARSGAFEDDDAGFQLVDQQPSDAQVLEHVVDAVVTFKAFAPVGLTERTNREVRSQALYPAELRACSRGKLLYCKGNPASTGFQHSVRRSPLPNPENGGCLRGVCGPSGLWRNFLCADSHDFRG